MAAVDAVMKRHNSAGGHQGVQKHGFEKVFDRDKVSSFWTISLPCKDIKSAEQCSSARIRPRAGHQNFFDAGETGMSTLLPRKRAGM